VDTALQALATARARGAAAQLVVAGGAADDEWRSLVARLGLADAVTFAGDVGEIERLHAASDAMLHPTRWDACSLATIEGMASGLPVVSATANGAADLIEHGVNGFLLDRPTDHESLAACILSLRDPALRRHIGDAARAAAAGADIAANCRAVEAVLLACGQPVPG